MLRWPARDTPRPARPAGTPSLPRPATRASTWASSARCCSTVAAGWGPRCRPITSGGAGGRLGHNSPAALGYVVVGRKAPSPCHACPPTACSARPLPRPLPLPRFFCDKLLRSFAPRFLDNVWRCKKVSDVGCQQMRLDTEVLKGLLADLARGGERGSTSTHQGGAGRARARGSAAFEADLAVSEVLHHRADWRLGAFARELVDAWAGVTVGRGRSPHF